MNNEQYEMTERVLIQRQLDWNDNQPLCDRKDAQYYALDSMQNPEAVAHNLDLLANGNYGQGALLRYQDILATSKRANKPAMAVQLLMALDHNCPFENTRNAWNMLSAAEKLALNDAVNSVLNSEVTA